MYIPPPPPHPRQRGGGDFESIWEAFQEGGLEGKKRRGKGGKKGEKGRKKGGQKIEILWAQKEKWKAKIYDYVLKILVSFSNWAWEGFQDLWNNIHRWFSP